MKYRIIHNEYCNEYSVQYRYLLFFWKTITCNFGFRLKYNSKEQAREKIQCLIRWDTKNKWKAVK